MSPFSVSGQIFFVPNYLDVYRTPLISEFLDDVGDGGRSRNSKDTVTWPGYFFYLLAFALKGHVTDGVCRGVGRSRLPSDTRSDETTGEVTFWRAEIVKQRLTHVIVGCASCATACARNQNHRKRRADGLQTCFAVLTELMCRAMGLACTG